MSSRATGKTAVAPTLASCAQGHAGEGDGRLCLASDAIVRKEKIGRVEQRANRSRGEERKVGSRQMWGYSKGLLELAF
jgi:hypothetical protein